METPAGRARHRVARNRLRIRRDGGPSWRCAGGPTTPSPWRRERPPTDAVRSGRCCRPSGRARARSCRRFARTGRPRRRRPSCFPEWRATAGRPLPQPPPPVHAAPPPRAGRGSGQEPKRPVPPPPARPARRRRSCRSCAAPPPGSARPGYRGPGASRAQRRSRPSPTAPPAPAAYGTEKTRRRSSGPGQETRAPAFQPRSRRPFRTSSGR